MKVLICEKNAPSSLMIDVNEKVEGLIADGYKIVDIKYSISSVPMGLQVWQVRSAMIIYE